MGLGLSRNLSGGPFSFRLSGNTWLFWVVCSCKKRKYERQGWGLGLLWGQGCHQDGSGQGKEGGPRSRGTQREKGGQAGFLCALLGPCHLPPLGCSVPASHSSTQPQSSLPGQSCTPGRCPTDTGQRLDSTHPSGRSQNMAAATLTGGLGTPPALCPQISSLAIKSGAADTEDSDL